MINTLNKKTKKNSKFSYIIIGSILIFVIIFAVNYLSYKNSPNYEYKTQSQEFEFKPPKSKNIMQPKFKIYDISENYPKPVSYSYKIFIKEKLIIVDETGKKLEEPSPDYKLFSINIIDYDIKPEEELQKNIKFEFEPSLKEEYYPGLITENKEIKKTLK